jgi:hypothetical protein
MTKNYSVSHQIVPLPQELEESGLNLFDPSNPDINLFNSIDAETIRLSGSKMYLYKYFQSTSNYDEVYMEDREKVISREPIVIIGHYDPTVLEEGLAQFGIEMTNDQLFTFNKSYIEALVGRPLMPGDVIKPFFQNQKYEIFEVQEDSFEGYGVYHLIATAKLLRDSSSTVDTNLTKTSDDLSDYEGRI